MVIMIFDGHLGNLGLTGDGYGYLSRFQGEVTKHEEAFLNDHKLGGKHF